MTLPRALTVANDSGVRRRGGVPADTLIVRVPSADTPIVPPLACLSVHGDLGRPVKITVGPAYGPGAAARPRLTFKTRLRHGRTARQGAPEAWSKPGRPPSGHRAVGDDSAAQRGDGGPGRAGTYTSAELAELFSVARSTVYRAVQPAGGEAVPTSANTTQGVTDELLVAVNPDPDSGPGYLLRLPLSGGMVFRTSLREVVPGLVELEVAVPAWHRP